MSTIVEVLWHVCGTQHTARCAEHTAPEAVGDQPRKLHKRQQSCPSGPHMDRDAIEGAASGPGSLPQEALEVLGAQHV